MGTRYVLSGLMVRHPAVRHFPSVRAAGLYALHVEHQGGLGRMQTCPLLQLSPDDGMERWGANDGRHANGFWSLAVRSCSAIGKRCS
jgi:hypothetical protein